MAPVNLTRRAKKMAIRKGPARSPAPSRSAAKMAPKPRRRAHEFLINHLREEDFKPDGLRSYAR
jgi:hypothetical protein